MTDTTPFEPVGLAGPVRLPAGVAHRGAEAARLAARSFADMERLHLPPAAVGRLLATIADALAEAHDCGQSAWDALADPTPHDDKERLDDDRRHDEEGRRVTTPDARGAR